MNEALTDPVRWDSTKAFRNERIGLFNDVAATTARRLELPFVDVFHDSVLAQEDAHITWDGLHLSTIGHDRMAHLVGRELAKLGWRAWTVAHE